MTGPRTYEDLLPEDVADEADRVEAELERYDSAGDDWRDANPEERT